VRKKSAFANGFFRFRACVAEISALYLIPRQPEPLAGLPGIEMTQLAKIKIYIIRNNSDDQLFWSVMGDWAHRAAACLYEDEDRKFITMPEGGRWTVAFAKTIERREASIDAKFTALRAALA
jgi:hypothetical protein